MKWKIKNEESLQDIWDYNKKSGNHDTGVPPFIRKKTTWLKKHLWK